MHSSTMVQSQESQGTGEVSGAAGARAVQRLETDGSPRSEIDCPLAVPPAVDPVMEDSGFQSGGCQTAASHVDLHEAPAGDIQTGEPQAGDTESQEPRARNTYPDDPQEELLGDVEAAAQTAARGKEDVTEAEKATAAEGNSRYFCTDARSILRGKCDCGKCDCWEMENFSTIWWRDLQQSSVLSQKAYNGEVCKRCGCHPNRHEDLQQWLVDIRTCMRRFRATGINTKRILPQKSTLPIEAARWSLDSVALYTLTLERLNPSLCHRPLSANEEEEEGQNPLISVCVPTSAKRHRFHPLLYQNFKRQDYRNKELVVIDTGSGPSRYLENRAKEDDSLLYYFFPVEDAREEKMETMSRLRARAGLPQSVLGPSVRYTQGENWSLGLKRNCAAHLSRGAIICHFDDDDLYAPGYLRFMFDELIQGVSSRRGNENAEKAKQGDYPAIATLSEWHLLDFNPMQFRYLDPKKEIMPEDWRSPMIYGYGFSYVYTRAAWEMQAFSDTETYEDNNFMAGLRAKNVSVTLVAPGCSSGMVAHSYHSDCTSGGEFNGNKRQGYVVEMPGAFEDLVPLAREIAKELPTHHPARLIEMHAAAKANSAVWTNSAACTGKGKGKWSYQACESLRFLVFGCDALARQASKGQGKGKASKARVWTPDLQASLF